MEKTISVRTVEVYHSDVWWEFGAQYGYKTIDRDNIISVEDAGQNLLLVKTRGADPLLVVREEKDGQPLSRFADWLDKA
jgi:hypothetical protein